MNGEGRMKEPTVQHGVSQILKRVRAVLGTTELDCRCRSQLDDALERFEALETRRQLRALIVDARHQAERIAALLELVSELDTVTTDETDLGVFDEIALLFIDIGLAASCGAGDMARAKSLAPCTAGSTFTPGDRNAR
ncbi:hypothetical protein DC522_30830 [Microvirga sp. KLBC 81]|nr:hypothetical protein DC522_30830 [Microvirga sp. KLBC 81]